MLPPILQIICSGRPAAFGHRKLRGMRDAILRTSLLLVCAVQATFGCEARSLELRQVSPNLTIVVTHRGKPIAGIEVQIVPEKSSEPVFAASTNENGSVLVRGLTAGQYYLTASHEDFEAAKEWIEVTSASNAEAVKRFDFQWADGSYQTSRVAGTLTGRVPGGTGNRLMDIVHPVKAVYPGVGITLRSAFSFDEYRTTSDGTGAFLMDNVPDGIYILTVDGGMKSISGIAEVTRQVVDVTRDVSRNSLPLQLKDTGCYSTEFQLAEDQLARTPLMDAIDEDDVQAVKLLLSKHVSVTESGNSPLIKAAGRGYPQGAQITKLLLDSGANPNAANSDGWTPLMSAEGFIFREPWGVSSHVITKELLARGADPNARSKTGTTPLIVAAGQPNHDDVSFLEELIDAGADPNAPDEDGKTALMSAAENGHVSKVRFLLENGASVNARDKSGKTALRYARPPRNKNDDDFPQCYESLSSDDLKPNNDCEATRRLLKSRM